MIASDRRVVGVAGWCVVLGALVGWQAAGVVRNEKIPTFTEVVAFFMHPRAGRRALFGLWLWIGWHFYRRAPRDLPAAATSR